MVMAEFIVESRGLCFLCLSKISNHLDQSTLDSALSNHRLSTSAQLHSLQHLASYLKLNMSKVFYEEGPMPTPSNLLAKVQKSKLKVELCADCADLNSKFTIAYRQLEKIQMEVRSKLDSIHQKMLGIRKNVGDILPQKSLIGECKSLEKDGEELSAKLKIADIIRSETMQSCSSKLGRAQPKVKVQKLTPKEEERIAEKIKSRNVIKVETEDDFSNLEDAYGEIYFNSDQEDDVKDKSNLKTVKCHRCRIQVEDLSSHHCSVPSEPGPTFNKKARANYQSSTSRRTRHHCDKCSKSFGNGPNLRRHQVVAHVGRRFRCGKGQCTKTFSTLSYLREHQKVFHLGQRLPCDHCNSTFSSDSNLTRHRQSVHQGKRYPCRYCSKTFSTSGNRDVHMKTNCSVKRANQ